MNKRKIVLFIIILLMPVMVFGAADYLHVTVAGAGNNDGQTWANAFAMADFTTDVTTNAEAGDVYYLADTAGYTPGAAWSNAANGTAVAAITIIGVKSGTSNEDENVVESDYSYGGNRPVIDMEANEWQLGNYWLIKNLDVTSTATYTLYSGDYSIVQNCKINNTNTNYGIRVGGYGRILNCEAQAAGNRAITADINVLIKACYIHDSSYGIYCNSTNIVSADNIIDECDIGINILTRNNCVFVGNTIYGSNTMAISGTTSIACVFINNILDNNVVGVDWTTAGTSNYFDYNIWDNTDDIADTDVVKGPHAITADPGLTDPAANPPDFTVGSGSNALDAGLQIYALTGNLIGDYKVNIGADQDDVSSSTLRGAGANLGGELQE